MYPDRVAGTDRVDILSDTDKTGWSPVVGIEALALRDSLEKLDEREKEKLVVESLSILSRCAPFHLEKATETGLVAGYVQAGKTMSFTMVTALARDNGCQLVILITGISTPLFNQSSDRLERDLRLLTRQDRAWRMIRNPSDGNNDRRDIKAVLDDWHDPACPQLAHQALLITVMKNHKRLENLISVLRRTKLDGVHALVIDDEADQAGLNTQAQKGNGSSPTYNQLLTLRSLLPHHTFLQYTATPQAPLLINIIDTLSPRFAEVLTPGSGYAGGLVFFGSDEHGLVREIPPGELPSDGCPADLPSSLLEAMRYFILGVAAGIIKTGGAGNRSMLIHPSMKTDGHRQYLRWVTSIISNWERTLREPDSDPDKKEVLDDFRREHTRLSETVDNLPGWDEIVTALPRALSITNVIEVNARGGKTPEIRWRDSYSHILVGGQAMDRGFTVEGLTVTYMPRSPGMGIADTMQQRARFFGYKKGYLGYCRVYLSRQMKVAYTSYTAHEEDIRERLISHMRTKQPLSEWRRAFFLDRSLRPTRRCVLSLDYMQDVISSKWWWSVKPHDSMEAAAGNSQAIEEFMSSLEMRENEGDPRRTPEQRHHIARDVGLADAMERFLTRMRFTWPTDSQKYTGLLLQVSKHLERVPDETCTIYLMSGGKVRWRSTETGDSTIKELFQGANYAGKETVYPGDREIKSEMGLTIQIHNLGIKEQRGSPDALNVPALAVWAPTEMAEDWLVQAEGE